MKDVAQSYAILKIPMNASPELSKQAYRKLAKIWHPDRYVNDPILRAKAENQIKKINQAYAVVKEHQEKNYSTVQLNTARKSSYSTPATRVAKTQHTSEFYYQQGIDYLKSEDYNSALDSFGHAIKLNPNLLEAYQCRGFILSKLGYDLRASAEFKKAKQIKLKNQVAKSYPQEYTSQDTSNSKAPLEFWRSIASGEENIKHLAIGYQGQMAVARNKNEIELWRIDTGNIVGILKGHTDSITCLVVSSDGRTLISGSQDQTIRFWDLEERKIIRTFGGYFDGHLSAVTTLAITRDNQILVSYGRDNSLKIWDISRGMEIRDIFCPAIVTCIAVSDDSRLFCSAVMESLLEIRNIKTGQVIRSIEADSEISSIAFSPDGNLLATGDTRGEIKLWDITTGKEIYVLTGHSQKVVQIIFSYGGKTLVSSSWDGTIKLWKLSMGELTTSITAHSSKIHNVAISIDRQLLATSSDKKMVKLWRCNL